MRLQVRSTFGQTLGQVGIWSDFGLVRSTPTPQDEASGQFDIWSDVPPQDEALGQVDIWSDFGLVRSTPTPQDEASGQFDIWSDVPPRMRFQV